MIADARPDSPSAQAIAAVVERIDVSAGEGIEAVEFVTGSEREGRGSDFNVTAGVPGSAQPARKIAIAVFISSAVDAVDSRCPLEADRAGKACPITDYGR